MLGLDSSGLVEGVGDFGLGHVTGGHRYLRATLKVDAQCKSTENNGYEANHQDDGVNAVPATALRHELNSAFTGVDTFEERSFTHYFSSSEVSTRDEPPDDDSSVSERLSASLMCRRTG